jgi:hypothetical protein
MSLKKTEGRFNVIATLSMPETEFQNMPLEDTRTFSSLHPVHV